MSRLEILELLPSRRIDLDGETPLHAGLLHRFELLEGRGEIGPNLRLLEGSQQLGGKGAPVDLPYQRLAHVLRGAPVPQGEVGPQHGRPETDRALLPKQLVGRPVLLEAGQSPGADLQALGGPLLRKHPRHLARGGNVPVGPRWHPRLQRLAGKRFILQRRVVEGSGVEPIGISLDQLQTATGDPLGEAGIPGIVVHQGLIEGRGPDGILLRGVRGLPVASVPGHLAPRESSHRLLGHPGSPIPILQDVAPLQDRDVVLFSPFPLRDPIQRVEGMLRRCAELRLLPLDLEGPPIEVVGPVGVGMGGEQLRQRRLRLGRGGDVQLRLDLPQRLIHLRRRRGLPGGERGGEK
jgi:hypothetical protein